MSTMNNNQFNSPPPQSDYKASDAERVVLGSLSSIVFLIGTIILCLRCLRKKTKPKPKPKPVLVVSDVVNQRIQETAPTNLDIVHIWEGDAATMETFLHDIAREKPIRFTAQQLSFFTNNYSKRLGSSGFGVVYQGQFPNGVNFAVKVLEKSTDKRVEVQFMAEVATIDRTSHMNLVRLYGFCFDNGMSALVYEFMENGSLDNILFKQNPGINWFISKSPKSNPSNDHNAPSLLIFN